MFDVVVDGDVTRIILDRPEKRNAVLINGWLELERIVQQISVSNAKVIVFQSNHAGSFCAGADLGELWQLSHDVVRRQRFRGAVTSAMGRIRTSGKPTVCVIKGGCYGIGVSLATACDIRIVSREAEFAITPAQFGMSYPQAELNRLIELVGRGQGARLIFGCERIGGREAHRIGLAEILDEDGYAGETLIQNMAANAPNSLSALKAGLLNRFGTEKTFDACFGTVDFAERYGRHQMGKAGAMSPQAR